MTGLRQSLEFRRMERRNILPAASAGEASGLPSELGHVFSLELCQGYTSSLSDVPVKLSNFLFGSKLFADILALITLRHFKLRLERKRMMFQAPLQAN